MLTEQEHKLYMRHQDAEVAGGLRHNAEEVR